MLQNAHRSDLQTAGALPEGRVRTLLRMTRALLAILLRKRKHDAQTIPAIRSSDDACPCHDGFVCRQLEGQYQNLSLIPCGRVYSDAIVIAPATISNPPMPLARVNRSPKKI